MSTTTDTAPEIGSRMPDGSVYAGVSPDTGRPMYTTPRDVPLTCSFDEAREYASRLDAHGHRDWRVPTKAELDVLFQNRAAIGNFDMPGSDPAGWYWSSSQNGYDGPAWTQRFSDGRWYGLDRSEQFSLRCVRG